MDQVQADGEREPNQANKGLEDRRIGHTSRNTSEGEGESVGGGADEGCRIQEKRDITAEDGDEDDIKASVFEDDDSGAESGNQEDSADDMTAKCDHYALNGGQALKLDTHTHEMDIHLERFISKLIALKPNYVGIYQPGDFSSNTYRVVLPDPPTTKFPHEYEHQHHKHKHEQADQRPKRSGHNHRNGSSAHNRRRGRGYMGCREEVRLETHERRVIDVLVEKVMNLVGSPTGPSAARHILNPSQAKDEGIRLIWPHDGMQGQMEVDDWPRRDRLIRAGKTVRGIEEDEGSFDYLQARASGDGHEHEHEYEYGYGHRYEYDFEPAYGQESRSR